MRRALGILFLGIVTATAGQWLRIEGSINGKSLRFVFDSGSNASVIHADAARRLGIRVNQDLKDKTLPTIIGVTEKLNLKVLGHALDTSLWVLQPPPFVEPDFDAILGWPAVVEQIISLDPDTGSVEVLSRLPDFGRGWLRMPLVPNSSRLALKVSTTRFVAVDTGSACGFALPLDEWRAWKRAHPAQALTLRTDFTPSDGFFAREEAWCEHIVAGRLALTGVPVTQTPPLEDSRWGPGYRGTLGLAALKRLDLVIDGRHGVAYARARRGAPSVYEHNRAGAIFAPTVGHTNQAVARVIAGGPAYSAGVRNGDILLQVNGIPVTSWDARWLGQFERPAGTKLDLVLERHGGQTAVSLVLSNIVAPSPSP